ncbi:kinase-like domain-containing protein [Mycena amicta]|nr:kinase-like domain-containing protein [Mycena amicta]
MADHPAFPTIHGVWRNRGHFFIAMELGGKCLADFKTLSRPQIYYFGRQLIDGLKALHRRGILHRDVKPDNLLVKGDKLVIIDFGLSRRFSLRRRPPRFWAYEQGEYVAHGVCGTKGYMSPLVLGGGDYSFEADLWSVGVVLHEWLVRRRDPPEISPSGNFLEEPDDHLSLAQWQFFYRIFSVDPQYRFQNWDAVKKHRMWLTLLE